MSQQGTYGKKMTGWSQSKGGDNQQEPSTKHIILLVSPRPWMMLPIDQILQTRIWLWVNITSGWIKIPTCMLHVYNTCNSLHVHSLYHYHPLWTRCRYQPLTIIGNTYSQVIPHFLTITHHHQSLSRHITSIYVHLYLNHHRLPAISSTRLLPQSISHSMKWSNRLRNLLGTDQQSASSDRVPLVGRLVRHDACLES